MYYFTAFIYVPEKEKPQAYQEYIAAVKPMVERFGGKYLARTDDVDILEGNVRINRSIIIQFETKEQIHKWLTNPEYSAIAKT